MATSEGTDMIDIVRRTALTVSFALACGIFPAQAAHAAGDAPAANGGGAVVKPYDANEAQLSGGPQAYDDIYESQMNDATQAPGTLPGMQTNRDATPEEHMLATPGMPQAVGGIAAPAARKAKATRDDPYALGGGTAPQPYGLGAAPRPVYKMPY
jgi:hypothetical protein